MPSQEIRPYSVNTDHTQCLNFWQKQGLRSARLLHADLHHDMDLVDRGVDEGNFVRKAVQDGQLSSVYWALPVSKSSGSVPLMRAFIETLPEDIFETLKYSDGIWKGEVEGSEVWIGSYQEIFEFDCFDIASLDLDVFYQRQIGGPLIHPNDLLDCLQIVFDRSPNMPLFIATGLDEGYSPPTFVVLFARAIEQWKATGCLRFDDHLLAFTLALERARLCDGKGNVVALRHDLAKMSLRPLELAYFQGWLCYLHGQYESARDIFGKTTDLQAFSPTLELLTDFRAAVTTSPKMAFRVKKMLDVIASKSFQSQNQLVQ